MIAVPFSDLYQKLLTDFATGTNSYDATVFAPQWMVDYIEPGYLEDITPIEVTDTYCRNDYYDFVAELRR
mgnify:CR=1 FL=1